MSTYDLGRQGFQFEYCYLYNVFSSKETNEKSSLQSLRFYFIAGKIEVWREDWALVREVQGQTMQGEVWNTSSKNH